MANHLRFRKRRFEADEIRDGDGYELSGGVPIQCQPTGGRGSDAAATGAAVLKSDPKVDAAGVETGYSPRPDTLRAPDIAVGNVPREPGWVKGVPPLAVEYADTGQDEKDLRVKLRELLDAGTRFVWVVRLTGPRRVEVHAPDSDMRTLHPGDTLEAPGILENPVPVEALYDWQVGQQITLRNLLQRQGYGSLDAVRAEGAAESELETLRTSILDVFAERGLLVDEAVRAELEACQDPGTLRRWLRRAITVERAHDLLADD
ncbi:MAG: Uma2 family endonuclease [Acidobacteriota bacterium]